jgi:uncharacterized protein (TIGR00255 family)
MLKSMTGFGKSEMVFPDKKITIEIKTLNSKGTDISVKLPQAYRSLEMQIRQLAAEKLERGKIDVLFTVDLNEGAVASIINTTVVKAYYNQFALITKELNIMPGETILSAILRLPDAVKTERGEQVENEWSEVSMLVEQAINEVEKFRVQEGAVLRNDVMKRINLILQKLDNIKPFEKPRIERIREKIGNSLLELKLPEEPDKNRFEQEIIYYLEKLDITEEKVRLRNHCNYFLETMDIKEPSGKKLGFITQEIGREINTIGSKASDSDIQKLVVEMKDELEKVKEQVLNVV